MYLCESISVSGFIQQLAVAYVSKGYLYYVRGFVKGTKDPRKVDLKIISEFEVDISKYTRYRKKAKGMANIQYLRFGRDFVILATPGTCDRFYVQEKKSIRDIKKTPIRFQNYSISYRGEKVHVRIADERYRELKSYLLDIALHRKTEAVEAEFRKISFEPYAPVKAQLLSLWYNVNRVRKKAGYEPISKNCIRVSRKQVKALLQDPSYMELLADKAA